MAKAKKKPDKKEKFFGGKVAEVTAALKVAWESGCNNVQACAFAGISYEALKRYWTKHPEFKMERKRLKHMPNVQAKVKLYKSIQEDGALAFRFLQVKERAEYGPQVGIIKADLSGEELSEEEIKTLKDVLVQEDIEFDEEDFVQALQGPAEEEDEDFE